MKVRLPGADEVSAIARTWFEAWRDAHAHLLPADLVRLRTRESFEARVARALDRTRVAGPDGAPSGLCMIKGDELEQLFVARDARGTGVAAALLADGEARLAASGVRTAWLACAIGNDRAARFYAREGWRDAGTFIYRAETEEGVFEIETMRFEKGL